MGRKSIQMLGHSMMPKVSATLHACQWGRGDEGGERTAVSRGEDS